jgi:hypothetical protein
MTISKKKSVLVVVVMWMVNSMGGCGGASLEKETTPTEETSVSESRPKGVVEENPASVKMEGLLGTISQYDVERAVKRGYEKMFECFQDPWDLLEEIEGSFELVMEVGADGSVLQVYLRDGDLGSRQAETCIVDKVAGFTFPAPEGGDKAMISYAMEIEEPYDHPEPHNWGGAKSREVLTEHMEDLEACLEGETGVTLTVYIGRGGKVVSAGATSSSYELYEAGLCLAKAAEAWIYPEDPGERPAKAVLEF